MLRTYISIAIVSVLTMGVGTVAGSEEIQLGQDGATGQPPTVDSYIFGGQLAQDITSSTDTTEILRTMVNSSIDYMLPTFGEDAPDYLKRVELDIKLQNNLKPEWSILTVQPLYSSEDNGQTVFTQLSQQRYFNLGTKRDVTNIGFGYRQLFADNTVLAGINTFFDYEWNRAHKRGGIGAEVKWSGLDFTANTYFALSDKTGNGLGSDVVEEVLDGRDFELSAQIPYLPWAKVHGRKYYWGAVANSDDIEGWSASVEVNLQQNVRIEAGMNDDNYQTKRENFATISFHIPFGAPRPTMASSELVSDVAWSMRDMREYTLDKVRRENKIIVERTSSGVVITRGN